MTIDHYVVKLADSITIRIQSLLITESCDGMSQFLLFEKGMKAQAFTVLSSCKKTIGRVHKHMQPQHLTSISDS